MKPNTNYYFKTFWILFLSLLISIPMFSQSIFIDASNQIPMSNPNGTDTVDTDLFDIDNDGDLDMFIAEGTAGFSGRANRLLLNDGNGVFTDVSISNLPLQPVPANSLSADFGDYDNDGDMDIIVANLGSTQLLLNDGNGIFTDISTTTLPPPPANILEDISTEIGFIDINMDGKLDIFITNEIPPIPNVGPGGSQNFLYVQQVNGTFTNESLTRLPNAKNQSASFDFGDIDNDGDPDLIVANVGQNQILINDGTGHFTNETTHRIAEQNSTSRSLVLEDIDCDADLDLIISNSNQEQNQIFTNTGFGYFEETTANSIPVFSDTSSDVKLFDFNYDGHPDLIFANAIPNPSGPATGGHPLAPAPNVIYLNDGTGVFSSTTLDFLPINNGISFDIEIADVNGDRIEDILVSNANDGEEELYLRNSFPPTRFRKIIPFTTCVTKNSDKTFTATFGYINLNRTPVYIPEGFRNRLLPYTIHSSNDQPVIFIPGIVRNAFTATFKHRILWKVNRKKAFASRWTYRCDDNYYENDVSKESKFYARNYPNPFSDISEISYRLPESNFTEIVIYNELGNKIATLMKTYLEKGDHNITVDANSLQLKQGLYFYGITSGTHRIVKPFIIKY